MKRASAAGQSLVEVAFVLPVLLLMLLGIFDFGRAIYAYNAVSNAAREAARVAIVDQKPAVVIAEGKRAAIGLDPNAVDVTFPAPPCALIGCTATVTVHTQWQPITPIISLIFADLDFESTTEMPIERVYTSP
jgi:Flp pilus assembly protein TadG